MLPVRTALIAPLMAALIVAAVATSLLAQEWRTAVAGPELILLGSGSRLSVLIRSGEARLLIAAGDDIDAFDRAYARVQRPTAPRLDLLIIAGTGRQLLVPERLVDRHAVREVLTLRPVGNDARGGVLADARIPTLRQRRDVRLEGEVTVSINPVPDHRNPDAWAITVSRGGMRLLIVPNAEALQPSILSHPASGLIILGKMDFETTPLRSSRSIIVHGDQAEAAIHASTDDPSTSGPWIWTVHDSEALTVTLKEGELRIPSSGARRLAPSTTNLAAGVVT